MKDFINVCYAIIALETLEKATQRDEVRRAVRGALFIISGRWNSPRSTTG